MNTKFILGQEPYEIVDGPSVDTIFGMCRYAYSKNTHYDGEFVFAFDDDTAGSMKEIIVSMIQHESGDEVQYNLEGCCTIEVPIIRLTLRARFAAYYNTRNRKGTVRFQA